MTRVLVTGSNGSLGSNVVAEAARRGLEVRALVRDPARAKVVPGVELIRGDALDAEQLTRALEGCDALFHLVNVAIGKDWVEVTARLLEAAITACKKTGARLVFPANVWIFGRGRPGELVDETRWATAPRAAAAPAVSATRFPRQSTTAAYSPCPLG